MVISRRAFLAGTAAFALWPKISFAGTGRTKILTEQLQATKTPGMAALVIRGFQAEPELVAGFRRLGSPDVVRPGDRWHLGSDAKAMVATLVARLVERELLSWTGPLAEMLPQFAATMHESYRDVTLLELLSHRSGLSHDLDDADFLSFHTDPSALSAQRLSYIDRALREPPAAEKRTAFSYSNTGYIVVAACAERATGQSFEALIVSEVFEPLGMSSISFDLFGAADGPSGHRDGRIADQLSDVNPRMFAPAGGISMNLSDWARFCIDQMQGEHGRGLLLSAEGYRLLHTPQGDTGFAALGWGYLPSAFGRRGPALFHAGSDGNWTALAMLFCETGNGVLVAANAYESMMGDRAANEVMRAIVPLIADAEPESEK